MKPIILASASPRRRDLMREAGLDCEIIASPAEELHDEMLAPGELTETNAALKADAVGAVHPECLIIGADTLVYIDGVPLGKPRDMLEAEAMLARLVGRTHEVCTGVCLCRVAPEKRVLFHVVTRVTFRPLAAAEIRAYLSLIEPLDKAGAYAAQEHGERIIERTEGSWTNVVGLPMERLREELARF